MCVTIVCFGQRRVKWFCRTKVIWSDNWYSLFGTSDDPHVSNPGLIHHHHLRSAVICVQQSPETCLFFGTWKQIVNLSHVSQE